MDPRVTTTRLRSGIGDERSVSLRRELDGTAFGLTQIVLRPGQRNRIHRHRLQEEVYLVLEGLLTLFIEGEALELGAGELVRVPPDVRRQLVNRGPVRLVLLAIGGVNEHVTRDGEAFRAWEDSDPVFPLDLPLPDDVPAAQIAPRDESVSSTG
jgi:mannose-6-phosphate isomerase-like protein (cupin superfamily)